MVKVGESGCCGEILVGSLSCEMRFRALSLLGIPTCMLVAKNHVIDGVCHVTFLGEIYYLRVMLGLTEQFQRHTHFNSRTSEIMNLIFFGDTKLPSAYLHFSIDCSWM
jgi:hypothetical protein